jgi:N-acetylmuramoyl-L-alanine amidase
MNKRMVSNRAFFKVCALCASIWISLTLLSELPVQAAETEDPTDELNDKIAAQNAADGVPDSGLGEVSPALPASSLVGDTTIMLVQNETCSVIPVRRTLANFAPKGSDLSDRQTRLQAMVQAILSGPTVEEEAIGLGTGLDRQARLESVVLNSHDSITVRLELPPGANGAPLLTAHQLHHFGDQVVKTLRGEGVREFSFQVRDPRTGRFIEAIDLFAEQGDDEASLMRARSADSHIPGPKVAPDQARELVASQSSQQLSLPVVPGPGNGGALSGKAVVLNPGHGWLDDHLLNPPRWRVQRSKLFENLEDFSNAEFFMHFLTPALLNAGARVQPVREMDSQTNMIIVDNADGPPNYVETGSWSNSTANGFVMRTGASWNGTLTNPWGNANATRFTNTVNGNPTATATYTFDVPATGYYNVYISYSASANRTTQAHWQVRHSGGTTAFRVNQQRDGATWVLLGNFHFVAGSPASQRQVVVLNDAPGGGVVTADAVRIGGGMGDVARRTNGVSGQPRWQEEACNYLQFTGMLASTLMSGDNTSAYTDEQLGWGNRPQFAQWEQSRDNEGDDTIYVGWHTNALNGGCLNGADNSGTARGSGVFRDTDARSTQRTRDLATALNTAFVNAMRQIYGQASWQDRGITASSSYGESSQTNLGTVSGVFFEALFHDNSADMNIYRDPKMREAAARSIVQGIITYYGGTVFPPEPPVRPRVRNIGGGQAVVEFAPGPVRTTNLPYGSAATTYRVYTSTNGYGFDNGTDTNGQTSLTINAPAGQVIYIQVRAVNSAGVSFPTETLAIRTPVAGQTPVLVVNGYNRFDRFLAPLVPAVSGCADNLVRRMDPRLFNSRNYVVQHADALAAAGVAFDNSSEGAIESGLVSLENYRTVIWAAGQEAEVDPADGVNDTAVKPNSRTALQTFLQNGGRLFISGSEIAWNYGRPSGPTEAERAWLTNNLRASLAADSSNVYTATPVAGAAFANVGAITFDNGNSGTYNVRFPDVLAPLPGAVTILNYGATGANGVAAIISTGTVPGGTRESRMIYMGFPFETIVGQASRRAVMAAAMQALGESPNAIYNRFPTGDGWNPLGQVGALLTPDIGSRSFDQANTALSATVAPSPRGRIIGWLESADYDLPYSAVGSDRFVRAKFHMFYSGPGNSADLSLANRVPNFRLSLRTRGVVNTQLEINHNAETGGSIAQANTTRELGPSKNPAAPSIYRVDLDPVDVPYLTSSTTEGIQRGFETLVSGADYSYVTGVLSMTDSSIGTYPVPNLGATPVKVFTAGGTPGSSDFDNPNVITSTLGASVSNIYRYLAGPSPADYFNPAVVTITPNEPGITVTKSPLGVTVNSSGLAPTRMGVADAAFVGGVFGETNTTRARVEPGRLYVLSFRLRHNGPSNTTPFTRVNMRSVGFGYNVTLELLGGRGLPQADARTFLAQVMPGVGNQVPGTTTDGTTYQLIMNSPLDPEIRADVNGTLAQKFPTLATQPGPGDPNGSLRNLDFGFTVVDSLSLASPTATDAAEVANGLTLNRMELRSYPQVAD